MTTHQEAQRAEALRLAEKLEDMFEIDFDIVFMPAARLLRALSTQPSEHAEISRLTSELEAARAVLPMTKDERTLMYADVLGFGDSDLQTMNRGDLDNLVDAVLRHVSLAQPSAPPAEQRPTAPKTNFGPYDEDDDISNLMGDDK